MSYLKIVKYLKCNTTNLVKDDFVKADIIFINGEVITADRQNWIVEAVAVKEKSYYWCRP